MSLIQQNMGAIYDGSQRLIAPVLNSTTATQRWEVGQEFILDGNLYKVTTAIPSGSQIVVSGSSANCALADTVTEQINDIGKPEIITLTDYDSTTMHIEYQNCWKSGHVVHIMARIKQLKAISTNIIAAETLPIPKCTGSYYYGLGFVYRNAALQNTDVLNTAIQKSTGYLRWNGGAGQVDDIIQIQFDYCTDE